MLLVVPNQLSFISKSNHIYILILFFIVKSIYNIVVIIFNKPINHLLYLFSRRLVMTFHEASSNQLFSAPFLIVKYSRRIHINNFMIQIAYYYCTSILIHDTLIKTHIRLELYVFLIIQSFLQMWFRSVYKELHADRETGC